MLLYLPLTGLSLSSDDCKEVGDAAGAGDCDTGKGDCDTGDIECVARTLLETLLYSGLY